MGSLDESTHFKPSLLDSALAYAQKSYTNANPQSKKSHDDACQYLPGGNTRTVLHTSPFPLTIRSGQSCFLTTADGHEYLDFLNEYTAGIYGHNNSIIRAAVEKALDGGWNYGAHSAAEKDLAKHICTRFPSIELVRFVNSGTEANMMALATALVLARKRSDSKTKVLVFEKGYHGSTISGRVDSGKPSINLPHDFVVGQYNDIEGTKELVHSLPSDSLAAILVEPMLGSGGGFPATHDFLSLLRQLATNNKALLIFDEVMTSRLSYSGFHATYGITPELVTLGKYLGGGFSFGAFGGAREIMKLYDPREGQLEHPGTFNNNVFSMHAGIAGAKLLSPERLNELNEIGDKMRVRIEEVLQRQGLYDNCTIPVAPLTDLAYHAVDAPHPQRPPKMFIKGVGSLMCIHFAGPEKELLQGLFWHHMLEQGIYMAQRGFISLSIEIGETEVNKFLVGVDSFVRQWDSVLRW